VVELHLSKGKAQPWYGVWQHHEGQTTPGLRGDCPKSFTAVAPTPFSSGC